MGNDEMKKAVAEKAVEEYVKDGMTVGLGTGSTAYYAIKRLGELVKDVLGLIHTRHLTASESKSDLDLIALLEELTCSG